MAGCISSRCLLASEYKEACSDSYLRAANTMYGTFPSLGTVEHLPKGGISQVCTCTSHFSGGWGTKTETERKRERERQRDRGVLSLWNACLILFNRFHPANYGNLNYFK